MVANFNKILELWILKNNFFSNENLLLTTKIIETCVGFETFMVKCIFNFR